MYSPAAFLITTGALTSIFNFFFGEYFREREKIYRLWLRVFAYGEVPTQKERRDLCSMIESKERMFRQAKAFLAIMLITLVACFIAFQAYSYPYIVQSSPHYLPDAWHTWKIYTGIMSALVLINAAETVYIQVAFYFRWRFPFISLRRRVTATQRLSMLWLVYGCPTCKRPEFNRNRLPRRFYKDLEDPNGSFGKCFISREFRFDLSQMNPLREDEDLDDSPPSRRMEDD